jgi:2-polyprenyl-6-methoxyphenol hydroxylase-like FAD-dependent oxidoreductase
MALREEVRRQRPLVSAGYLAVPQMVVRRRVVLVGDAAGCCHPLTATGLTTCTRDALRLRDAIAETHGNVPQALRKYSACRRIPEWTRLALATALYFTFREQSPEMHLLREGLMRYWKADANSRAVSMSLLSTCEGRMTVMAQEFAKLTVNQPSWDALAIAGQAASCQAGRWPWRALEGCACSYHL